MSRKRNTGITQGLKYRGGGPMLSWELHRIGGLAMVLFVGLHIIAGFFMQQLGSNWATVVNTVYESVYFQLIIIFLVLFHAFNGLRIIVLDFWPKLLQYQREVTWLQWLVFIPTFTISAAMIIFFELRGG